MSDQPIRRGGSASARAKGQRGIVVHVSPAEYEKLKAAAAERGLTLKEFCRQAALLAARG